LLFVPAAAAKMDARRKGFSHYAPVCMPQEILRVQHELSFQPQLIWRMIKVMVDGFFDLEYANASPLDYMMALLRVWNLAVRECRSVHIEGEGPQYDLPDDFSTLDKDMECHLANWILQRDQTRKETYDTVVFAALQNDYLSAGLVLNEWPRHLRFYLLLAVLEGFCRRMKMGFEDPMRGVLTIFCPQCRSHGQFDRSFGFMPCGCPAGSILPTTTKHFEFHAHCKTCTLGWNYNNEYYRTDIDLCKRLEDFGSAVRATYVQCVADCTTPLFKLSDFDFTPTFKILSAEGEDFDSDSPPFSPGPASQESPSVWNTAYVLIPAPSFEHTLPSGPMTPPSLMVKRDPDTPAAPDADEKRPRRL